VAGKVTGKRLGGITETVNCHTPTPASTLAVHLRTTVSAYPPCQLHHPPRYNVHAATRTGAARSRALSVNVSTTRQSVRRNIATDKQVLHNRNKQRSTPCTAFTATRTAAGVPLNAATAPRHRGKGTSVLAGIARWAKAPAACVPTALGFRACGAPI
jgi:hypothetical protein